MFFTLSKVLWIGAAPTNLLVALALAGTISALAGRRRGLSLAAIAVVALLLCGVLPVGRAMLLPLEDRFPRPALDGMAVPAGIVVLGGAIDQAIGAARGTVSLGQGAERVTAGAVLARRFPGVPVVYTGGSNALVAVPGSEAEDARRLWVALGVDPGRILIESRSRNTAENALFTRDLVHPTLGRRWILVTSAYHMPRAVGLFRAAGFDVVPFPVDYRSTGTWRDWLPGSDLATGLAAFDMATREWIGLASYRLSGRTPDLLPSP